MPLLHEANVPQRGVVLIHPATAVPQALYTAFAAYLVSRGFTVLTYDYRGIGGSRQGSLKGFKARMRDWADLDAEAVTLWARQRFCDAPLMAIGHEWRRWVGMDRYFFDDPSMDATARFARPRMPVLAIGFDDDPWATPSGIDLLTSHLNKNANRPIEIGRHTDLG